MPAAAIGSWINIWSAYFVPGAGPGDPAPEGGSNGWGALDTGAIRDTLDFLRFPKQGSRTQLTYTSGRSFAASDRRYTAPRFVTQLGS